MPNPRPIVIPTARRAVARLFIDLALAFHATTLPLGKPADETDANQALVAVAVMLGHAEGRPMNASQIAACVRMPRTSVLRRLDALVASGLVERTKGTYVLAPHRAMHVPHRKTFDAILSQAFAALGPGLSKMDT